MLKTSWQITSRFDGVIKKLHYEAGDMAQVGKASPNPVLGNIPSDFAITASMRHRYPERDLPGGRSSHHAGG